MARLGVDLGGTKIEAAVMGPDGEILSKIRCPTPDAYDAALSAVRDLVLQAETQAGCARVPRLGVAAPGRLAPDSGLVRNSSALWLNGRPLAEDLADRTGREVRVANDANCFALSEAVDGAGGGRSVVLGVILGTGCGGGLVVRGDIVEGARRLAGELGHTPLPWPSAHEREAGPCWCGRKGCLELFVSGPAFTADYVSAGGEEATAQTIVERARTGEARAGAALDRYIDRLARGLAAVCGVLDPDVVVLGGGMSNVVELCERLPAAMSAYGGAHETPTPVAPARHGDSSGVRGAAWLWSEDAP